MPLGFFCPGAPMASDAGLAPMTGLRDMAKVRTALRDAGYRGEPVPLMVPSTSSGSSVMGTVAADTLKQAGMNVEAYAVEFTSMLQRRNREGPVSDGGWSAFVANRVGTDRLNSAVHIALRGAGEMGYAGCAGIPRIEALRSEWFAAADAAAQQAICRELQLEATREVPYYPLGQYLQPTADRANIAGLLDGFATFWNVRRA